MLSSSTLSSLLTLFQPHLPPGCFSNMPSTLPPLSLCMDCSSSQNALSPVILVVDSLFWDLDQMPYFQESFSWQPHNIAVPSSFSLLFCHSGSVPICFTLFLHSTFLLLIIIKMNVLFCVLLSVSPTRTQALPVQVILFFLLFGLFCFLTYHQPWYMLDCFSEIFAYCLTNKINR